MEIKGTIKDVLEAKSGNGKNGAWKVQSFVIVEDKDHYPNGLVFEVFGEERIKKFDLKKGDKVLIKFDTKLTDYKGKYYNQIRAYSCERTEGDQTTAEPEKTQQSANKPQNSAEFHTNEQTKDTGSDMESSELPF